MNSNLQKRTSLIINELHQKTHETTGNKPEINNKHNMNRNNHKHIYVINLFAHSLQSLATFAFNPYNSANAHNLQNWIVLIINDLSNKTHETSGNKPAILENTKLRYKTTICK